MIKRAYQKVALYNETNSKAYKYVINVSYIAWIQICCMATYDDDHKRRTESLI